MVPMGHLLPAT